MRAKTDIVPLSYRVEDAGQVIGLGRTKMWELINEGAIPAQGRVSDAHSS